MTRRVLAVALVAALVVAACGDDDGGGGGAAGDTATVTLLTHDSFNVSDEVLAQLRDEHGIELEIRAAGDAGSLVNQAILTKDHPLGDVLFGVDTTFLSRALEAEIFEPHEVALPEGVDESLAALAEDGRVVPIDFGDVCVNYDKAWFEENDLPLPTSLEDLAEPTYAQHLVVENPATSSPGLAFLLATVAAFGEDGWEDFWRELRAGGVVVASDWEEAYNVQFSGSAGEGPHPLVVSYASSPPAEVLFADPQPAEAPTGVIEATCYRQVELAGVLAGTDRPDEARTVLEFLLSPPFQEDVPLSMFVFPVHPEAALPEVFAEHAVVPDDPFELDPALIHANRDDWIDRWTDIVLG